MGRKSEKTAPSTVSDSSAAIPATRPAVVVVDEDTAKGVELMTDEELVAIHEELCSGEPPDCTRTYFPRDYRAHVLLLIAEKQKRIA